MSRQPALYSRDMIEAALLRAQRELAQRARTAAQATAFGDALDAVAVILGLGPYNGGPIAPQVTEMTTKLEGVK